MAAGVRNTATQTSRTEEQKSSHYSQQFLLHDIWIWGGRMIIDLQHCIAVLPSHLEKSCSIHDIHEGSPNQQLLNDHEEWTLKN